jgi:F-type H+-transporting ATPase subunit epsilon
MQVEIISPEKIIFEGVAESITLPGISGLFTILDRHAPIISVLGKGKITYNTNGEEFEIIIDGGFVEEKNNVVSICID